MLSPRSLLELAPYLRETFSQGEDPNDEDAPECEQERTIVDCNLCMSIVTSVSPPSFLPRRARPSTFSPPIHLCADSRGRSLDPGLRLPEQGLRDSVAHFLCRSTTRSRRSVSRPTGPEQRQRVSAVSRLTLAPRSPRSSPGFAQLRTPGRVLTPEMRALITRER